MVKSAVAAWMHDLRPSMQDPQSPPQSAQRRRRRVAGATPRHTGLWHPDDVPATPKSLLAITPPRPSRGDKHGAARAAEAGTQHVENRPPYNSPPRATRVALRGRPSSPRSSSETQRSVLNDSVASSTARELSPLSGRLQPRGSPAPRSRSRSPLRRLQTSPGEPVLDGGTGALISHISHLRSALRAAYGKLDTLEKERSALKQQLSDVASDTGAHAARMRVLEKQLQAARRQDEGKLSSALNDEQQKNDALRKTLDHRMREVALLSGELKERDGQIVQLQLARDAALDDADRLRGEVIDLQHSLETLQESLRVLEQHNVDLADKQAALEDAVQEAEAQVHGMKEQQRGYAHDGDAVQQLGGWLLPASPRAACGFQDEPAKSSSARSQSEVARGVKTHAHHASNHPRLLRASARARCYLRDGARERPVAIGADAGSDGPWPRSPDWMLAEGEARPGQDLDLQAASAQYVRKEVLDQVKLKAKADLVQLESELMAVILAMEAEHRGAAGGGKAVSPTSTPKLTPTSRPDSAERSLSPGAISSISPVAARTRSSPAQTAADDAHQGSLTVGIR